MIKVYNDDFTKYDLPEGIIITDPPYNQKYKYSSYKDNLSEEDYIKLLSKLRPPCVIIHYPEETINLLPKAISAKCEQTVIWVYNSMTPKQSRIISWWGCKPNFSLVKQPYKNLNDKRIQAELAKGKEGANLYDWWEIQQVKNVSREKTGHPCQIPEEVMRRIILTTVPKDVTIIDPFAGSGTTIKVANDLGYDAVGFEIDKSYCDIITERVTK